MTKIKVFKQKKEKNKVNIILLGLVLKNIFIIVSKYVLKIIRQLKQKRKTKDDKIKKKMIKLIK